MCGTMECKITGKVRSGREARVRAVAPGAKRQSGVDFPGAVAPGAKRIWGLAPEGAESMIMTGARLFASLLKAYGVSHVFFMDAVLRRALAEMEDFGITRVLGHSE